MSGLFIASRRVEHDGSRRVIAAGALTGDGGLHIKGPLKGAGALAAAVITGRLERMRQQFEDAAARETAS